MGEREGEEERGEGKGERGQEKRQHVPGYERKILDPNFHGLKGSQK